MKKDKLDNKSETNKSKKNISSLTSRIFSFILLAIGIALLIYSSIHLYKWYVDSVNTSNVITKVNELVTVEENPEDSSIKVDLSELKKVNPDTVGWIQVVGTDVNYPFVQTTDNDFYLTHSFDKTYNSAGWVFLDYRNNLDNFNKNTILYAHGRLDKTMFGSLKDVFEPSWYDNSDNHIIKISTESQNTIWQIFSTYHIPATNDYIQTSFESDNEFESFINMIKNRSTHNFNTSVDSTDNILTLSTCYNNNGSQRLVIHAKLKNESSNF